MATLQPLPAPPTTKSSSVAASVKKTWLKSSAPLIWTMGLTSMPGWSMGTSR